MTQRRSSNGTVKPECAYVVSECAPAGPGAASGRHRCRDARGRRKNDVAGQRRVAAQRPKKENEWVGWAGGGEGTQVTRALLAVPTDGWPGRRPRGRRGPLQRRRRPASGPRAGLRAAGPAWTGRAPRSVAARCRQPLQGAGSQAGQVGPRLGRRAVSFLHRARVVPERGALAQRDPDALVRRVHYRQAVAVGGTVRSRHREREALEAAARGVPQMEPGPGARSK